MKPPNVIVHGGALGDLVLTLSLALRWPGRDPGAPLRVISRVDPGLTGLTHPPIEWISSDTVGLHVLYGGDAAPSPRLRALLTGARALSALGSPGEPPHASLARLAERVYSFDPRATAVDRHITAQWAARLGVTLAAAKSLMPTPECRIAGAALAVEHGAADSAIVLHPGSGGMHKCWPGFLSLADQLACRDRRVLVLLGPAEQERWGADAIAGFRDRHTTLLSPSPHDLALILATAAGYVGNDSGVTHLRALLGGPTVAVFGPTTARVWRPIGPRTKTIAADPTKADWALSPASLADDALADLGAGSAE